MGLTGGDTRLCLLRRVPDLRGTRVTALSQHTKNDVAMKTTANSSGPPVIGAKSVQALDSFVALSRALNSRQRSKSVQVN